MKKNIGIKKKAKIAKMRISTMMHFGVTDERIDDWLNNTTIFFLLGLGRSGTEFFAKLLNKANHTIVYHEPVIEDFSALVKAHQSQKDALTYMKKFRKKAIYILGKKEGVKIYGESNSNLRFHAKALKSTIPNVKIIHVVRDGRDVVRSIMAQKHYLNDEKGHYNIIPASDDPLFTEWHGLSRFEKICWLWADANRKVCEFADKTLNFEKLIGDYSYFKENIVDYLGIEISEDCWKGEVNRPKNITKKHSMPHWTEWEDEVTNMFWRICKDEMYHYGYVL
jgi:Sulfotransferase family